MRSGAKCTNWGSLGHLGVTQGHRQCHHSIAAYDFLFDFNRNRASILYRFRDITGYLSKVAHFDPPPAFGDPVGGDPGRVPGLSCGVVCVILCLAVLVELRLVTDGQRDTGPWLVPRMHNIAR